MGSFHTEEMKGVRSLLLHLLSFLEGENILRQRYWSNIFKTETLGFKSELPLYSLYWVVQFSGDYQSLGSRSRLNYLD